METSRLSFESSDRRSGNKLDEEVTIKLRVSPRKILKWFIVILLFVCVFYLGRLSVGGSCESVATTETPEAEPKEADSSFFSNVAGFFSAFFSGSDKSVTPPQTNKVNDTEEATSSTDNETVTDETDATENASAVADEEPIVTTYGKVALALTGVDKEWKGNWGKITRLKYTIKNNEEGTIKPDHFMMMVEGYTDFEKKVSVPPGSKTIKAHVTASSTATVVGGFSYSELAAGDLTNVDITLTMYDAGGKIIASVKKGFDLKS